MSQITYGTHPKNTKLQVAFFDGEQFYLGGDSVKENLMNDHTLFESIISTITEKRKYKWTYAETTEEVMKKYRLPEGVTSEYIWALIEDIEEAQQ